MTSKTSTAWPPSFHDDILLGQEGNLSILTRNYGMLDILRFNPLPPPSLLRPQPWLKRKKPITLSNNKVMIIYVLNFYPFQSAIKPFPQRSYPIMKRVKRELQSVLAERQVRRLL